MDNITLEFPNLQLLSQFNRSLQEHAFSIRTANNQLTFRCSSVNLRLAIHTYEAIVIKVQA